jgi:hypothetical protein
VAVSWLDRTGRPPESRADGPAAAVFRRVSYPTFIVVDSDGYRMLEQTQHRRVACPECGTKTINVQGVDVCPDCAWVADDDGRRPTADDA